MSNDPTNSVKALKEDRVLRIRLRFRLLGYRAVFDGGSEGFDPPEEVADPPESSAEPLWGSTLTSLKNPPIPFSC